tara:strand:+ start:23180 stop:23308 length:129 start_codon:yes stop_codon:yes gene_type:complete
MGSLLNLHPPRTLEKKAPVRLSCQTSMLDGKVKNKQECIFLG